MGFIATLAILLVVVGGGFYVWVHSRALATPNGPAAGDTTAAGSTGGGRKYVVLAAAVGVTLFLVFVCGVFNSPIYQYRARRLAEDVGGADTQVHNSSYSCVNLGGIPGTYCGASASFVTDETEAAIERRIRGRLDANARVTDRGFNELAFHSDWMKAEGVELVTETGAEFPIQITTWYVADRGGVSYITPRYEHDYFTLKGIPVQGAIIRVYVSD